MGRVGKLSGMEAQNLYQQVKSEVKKTRKECLNLLEASLHNDENRWIFIRSRILSLFGNQGLDGFIDEIFEYGKESEHVRRMEKQTLNSNNSLL